MLCVADAVGVFQVESRAQMNFLPRMLPRTFYDLVIEVAIIRPGPIQGGMVHPYINRRQGKEPVNLPSTDLRPVLERTLGVPLFQEQAMQIAVVAAGFSPEEADRLRRSLATFKRMGTIATFRDRFISGMLERGYDLPFAEQRPLDTSLDSTKLYRALGFSFTPMAAVCAEAAAEFCQDRIAGGGPR